MLLTSISPLSPTFLLHLLLVQAAAQPVTKNMNMEITTRIRLRTVLEAYPKFDKKALKTIMASWTKGSPTIGSPTP